MELYGNKIAIYDQFMRRIQFYNLEGKFLKSVKFPFYSMKFHIFNDNQYLFNSIICDNDEFRSIVNYSVFETDSTGTFTSRGFYRKKNTYQSLVNRHNFFPEKQYRLLPPGLQRYDLFDSRERKYPGRVRREFRRSYRTGKIPERKTEKRFEKSAGRYQISIHERRFLPDKRLSSLQLFQSAS